MTASEAKSVELVEQGIAKASEGNYSEAFQLFNEALSRDPKQGMAYYLRGLLFAGRGNHQEAIKDLTQAIEINPDGLSLADIYVFRGNCYEELDDKRNAMKDYEKAIQINPNFISAHHRKGSILFLWGMMSNPIKVDTTELLTLAVEEFDFVVQSQPDNIQVYEQRGRTRSMLGDKVGAIEDFSVCIQQNPNYHVAYQERGMAFSQLGRNKDAVNDMREVLEICLAQGDIEGCEMADFFIKSWQNQDAYPTSPAESPKEESEFDFEAREPEILSTNASSSTQANYYYNLGCKLFNEGESNEAISALQQAIQIDPNYAMAYCILGVILKHNNLLNESVIVFKKAIELNPNDSRFHENLGYVLAELYHLPEALEAFQKAVHFNTSSVGVYHFVGDILKEQGNMRDAIKAYRKAIQLAPNVVNLYSKLASTLAKYKHDPSEAIAMFYQGIERDPDYPETYFELAMFLTYIDRNTEALPAMKKAYNLYQATGDEDGVLVAEQIMKTLT